MMKKEFYRGESKKFEFPCTPSIMRFIKNNVDAISLESKYYNNCLKYLNDVRAYSRKKDVCVEHIKELSYLQHYGFNTRLLDITDDQDVAFYFASCENFDDDGVIYSINDVEQRMSCDVQSVHRKIECIMNGEEIKGKKLKEYFNKKGIQLSTISKNIILDYCTIFKIKEKNIRYDRQNGYFILFGNKINKGYLSNELTELDTTQFKTKTISSKDKLITLLKLCEKGIHSAYLFPDSSQSYYLKSCFDKIGLVENKENYILDIIKHKYREINVNVELNKDLVNEIISDFNKFVFIMVELFNYYREKNFNKNEIFKKFISIEKIVKRISK